MNQIRTCINPIADFICRQIDTKTSWRHVYLGRQISVRAGTMSPLVKVQCVAQVPRKVPHKVQPLKLHVRHFLILPLLIQARNRRQTLPSMSFPKFQMFLGNKVSCKFHRDRRQWSLQQLLGPFLHFHPIWPILFLARHYNRQSLQVSRWGAKGRWVHY